MKAALNLLEKLLRSMSNRINLLRHNIYVNFVESADKGEVNGDRALFGGFIAMIESILQIDTASEVATVFLLLQQICTYAFIS